MTKLFSKIFLLAVLLCGCYQGQTKSYFYEIALNNLEKDFHEYYEVNIDRNDDYSIYLNYFVKDREKWSETIDFLKRESEEGEYKSSVFIFDERKRLIYSVDNYFVHMRYISKANGIIAMQVFPKYISLKKGKKYYFDINITNINPINFNNYKKQIEITTLYRSK